MITGVPSIDGGLQISEQLIKSQQKRDEFNKNLITKLKNSNRKEREFIIFKTFFNTLTDKTKEELINIVIKHPFMIDRLWWVIDEANSARKDSKDAIYNRDICYKEIMAIYKSLLEKVSKLAKELNMNNSLELSILFSYLLWNGYLSKTKTHEYKEFEGPLLMGMNFTDISNGIGVCRNYSEMLKDFLNNCGYQSVMLANYLDDDIKVDYKMNITERRIYNIPSNTNFTRKKANHAFNLIEDNGLYIYDSTNLLLYDLKNINSSVLINGKGKNKIYPYQCYGYCYSKDDEKLLDRLFTEEDFTSPYTKTDFISTSEVNLELIKNNTSLLEDFYTEARQDIVGISEKTKKALKRTR